MVSQLDNGLALGFVTDLRAAEDDFDAGPNAPEGGNHGGGGFHVPNIDAKPDDFRFLRQQGLDDVQGPLVDVKFRERGAGLQGTEIGQQVAQSKSGMDVFCVERG